MWSGAKWLFRLWGATEEGLRSLELSDPGQWRNLLSAADNRLKDWDTLEAYIEGEGYTAAAVRAVYEHHFGRLYTAKAGSVQHLVWIDFQVALPRCTVKTNRVLRLLGYGFNTKEIAGFIGGNGSRLVNAAAEELSRELKGVTGASVVLSAGAGNPEHLSGLAYRIGDQLAVRDGQDPKQPRSQRAIPGPDLSYDTPLAGRDPGGS